MQTYLIHWQFPNQEVHMKGADVLAQYVENGGEADEFKGLGVVKIASILKVLMDERFKNIRSQSSLEVVTALV